MKRYKDIMGQVWFDSDATRVENIETHYEELIEDVIRLVGRTGITDKRELIRCIANNNQSQFEYDEGMVTYLAVDYIMNMTQDDAMEYLETDKTNHDLCQVIFEHVADDMNLSVYEVQEYYYRYDLEKIESLTVISDNVRFSNAWNQ